MDHQRLILFERFHSLDLPAHELHTFHQLLESDPAFRREYEHFELATQCVHRYGEMTLRNELMLWHIEALKHRGKQNKGMKKVLYTFLFLGIFALSFILFSHLKTNSHENKFKELYGLYPIQLSPRNQSIWRLRP